MDLAGAAVQVQTEGHRNGMVQTLVVGVYHLTNKMNHVAVAAAQVQVAAERYQRVGRVPTLSVEMDHLAESMGMVMLFFFDQVKVWIAEERSR